ncbi:MAG: hypothetical protein A2170_08470 [Deltaproteobacteria bacterium RBG_13_53_10]|nr:MAG: hypothetical protein A2170_08470 [Deltaproteobacteria bacterium RBG_13_53_10]
MARQVKIFFNLGERTGGHIFIFDNISIQRATGKRRRLSGKDRGQVFNLECLSEHQKERPAPADLTISGTPRADQR